MVKVDARGDACPLPVVKAKKAIAAMDLSEFSLFALNDAAEYLYGEKPAFASSADAQEYFRKRAQHVG